jgi:acyl carrier protein
MDTLLTEKEIADVQDILIEELGVKRAQLTAAADLVHDLGADSLTKVEITLHVEEHFGITIPDEETERVSTVGDLMKMLGELRSSRPGNDCPAATLDKEK